MATILKQFEYRNHDDRSGHGPSRLFTATRVGPDRVRVVIQCQTDAGLVTINEATKFEHLFVPPVETK